MHTDSLSFVPDAPAFTQPAALCRESGPLEIRLHPIDRSIFIDGQYLIRGIAGALLWKMLNDFVARGRTEFCYREMRLDPSLKLPDGVDNMGARMALLQRRLDERCPALRIEKRSRGMARLVVLQPVRLAVI